MQLDCVKEARREFNLVIFIINSMMAVDPAERFVDLRAAINAISKPELYALELVKASYRRCTESEGASGRFLKDF